MTIDKKDELNEVIIFFSSSSDLVSIFDLICIIMKPTHVALVVDLSDKFLL